jgi:hypothetical protein
VTLLSHAHARHTEANCFAYQRRGISVVHRLTAAHTRGTFLAIHNSQEVEIGADRLKARRIAFKRSTAINKLSKDEGVTK